MLPVGYWAKNRFNFLSRANRFRRLISRVGDPNKLSRTTIHKRLNDKRPNNKPNIQVD